MTATHFKYHHRVTNPCSQSDFLTCLKDLNSPLVAEKILRLSVALKSDWRQISIWLFFMTNNKKVSSWTHISRRGCSACVDSRFDAKEGSVKSIILIFKQESNSLRLLLTV